MSTTNSGTFTYCTSLSFIQRYDVRTIGDYLSDDEIRVSPANILTSILLGALLQQASGTLESFATRGNRYSIDDLIQIACLDPLTGLPLPTITNSANMMYGIVAGLTMFYLWNRRPARFLKNEMPAGCEEAWAQCQALGEGKQIFGLLEVAEAATPDPEFMTRSDIFKRNFSSNQAHRFFGRRAQYRVPGPDGQA